MLECFSTAWVSLPYQSSLRPRRPCEDIRIRSQPCARAASMIASCGRLHSAYAVWHSMPAARSRSAAGCRIACALSRERRSWSHSETALRAISSASPGGWYSGTAVKRVTLTFAPRAKSTPAWTALSAVGEPSIGMRMCLYTRAPVRGIQIQLHGHSALSCHGGRKCCCTAANPARVLRTGPAGLDRSEEHTSELQSHSFISYAVFFLTKTQPVDEQRLPIRQDAIAQKIYVRAAV